MRSEADGELRRRLVAALESEPSVAAATRKAGCARSLAYKLARSDERVAKAMAAAQAKPAKGRKRAAAPSDVPAGLREKALTRLNVLVDDHSLSARDALSAIKLALDVTNKPTPAAPAEVSATPDYEAERQRAAAAARGLLVDADGFVVGPDGLLVGSPNPDDAAVLRLLS